jgi:peptidylprolyl isomerase
LLHASELRRHEDSTARTTHTHTQLSRVHIYITMSLINKPVSITILSSSSSSSHSRLRLHNINNRRTTNSYSSSSSSSSSSSTSSSSSGVTNVTNNSKDNDSKKQNKAFKLFTSLALSLTLLSSSTPLQQAQAMNGLPDDEDVKVLCDTECVQRLDKVDMQTTASGLQYKDIIVGDGELPPIGFQVVVDYVFMNSKGLIFDNSLEKGKPNDIRLTGDASSATVIAGLDEGLLSMRSGGTRRLYIPGELAFPKGLSSAPGRPAIPPNSPVTCDVKLIYIPGID